MPRKLVFRITGLLVILALLAGVPVAAGPALQEEPPLTDDPELQAIIERLRATPHLTNLDTGTVAETFQRGQELGKRADVFTKVGDSDTTSGDFLQPFGIQRARFCDLGDYHHLRETVEYYWVSPHEDIRNSWVNPGIAATNGLSTAAALNSFWAQSPECRANESPLACEYRLLRPAVAIIKLGRMDVLYFEADVFRANYERIIEESLAEGVIPVLTTFIVLRDVAEWEASIRFNDVILDLAEEYDIPLINLWAAAEALPQHGIGPDRTHLSHAVGHFCDFTGAQDRYGGTLRNLFVLQVLDELRRAYLDPE
jgi:hypothetical protein